MNKYFFLLFFFVFFCCTKKTETVFHKGFALGTSYSIQYAPENLEYEKVQKGIDSLFKLLNQSLSTYIPNSDISKINRGDSLLIVDMHFVKVYKKAKEIWEKTEGYFDPTVGALVNAYGFGPEKPIKKLSSSQRDSIMELVGWDKTELTTNNTIKKQDPNLYFDFNALAKGYVVDVIADYLEALGSQNHLVEIGGELVGLGNSPRTKKPWTIAIENPNMNDQQKLIKILTIKNRAIATSGNYRKFKIDSDTGQRFVHSINPISGQAVPSPVLSATVLAPNCIAADAWATALMVMPLEKSMNLINSEPSLEAYWVVVNENGSINEVFSKGFDKP